MDEKVKQQMEEMAKKARESTEKSTFTRGLSSLHNIIKTKEQADRFMKLLESA